MRCQLVAIVGTARTRSLLGYRSVSAKLTGDMTGNVVYLLLLFVAPIFTQYNDDSDYSDFQFYENLPTSYERDANDNYHRATAPDDFYIISDLEDSRGTWNSGLEERPTGSAFDNEIADKKPRGRSQREKDWYERPERIYRYTKHRIPGYDYDELDFMSPRGYQQCDDKSSWTNCVCQFTCQYPNVVDCFTPCKNGCECKEDYVYDVKSERCILPEKCDDPKDYSTYEK